MKKSKREVRWYSCFPLLACVENKKVIGRYIWKGSGWVENVKVYENWPIWKEKKDNDLDGYISL